MLLVNRKILSTSQKGSSPVLQIWPVIFFITKINLWADLSMLLDVFNEIGKVIFNLFFVNGKIFFTNEKELRFILLLSS